MASSAVCTRISPADYAGRLRAHTPIDLDSGFAFAHFALGLSYTEISRFDEALMALEKAVGFSRQSPEIVAGLGYCAARAGNIDRARMVLNELLALSQKRYVSAALVSQTYAALGEVGTALDWLERAGEAHAADLAWLGVRPTLDSLRSKERFVTLCAKVGVPPDSRRIF